MNMNKNIKRKIITAAAAALIAFSAVSGAAIPVHAAIGTSVNEEVINQARAVASLIQTRVQLYWSMWVDKQIPYTQDPLSNPEPTWATDAEVLAAVGGYEPDGVSFAVDAMPLDRKGSFYLVATLDSSMGGAAAASYVRNFLPMAVASGSTVTVPVLRPSFALGLNDLMDNPNKVNRDGSTDDGSPTFSDGSTIRFGDGGTITFDGTGGDISNVNTLSARDGSFSNNLTVGNKLTADTAEIENADIGTLTAGNTTINGTLDVSGQITGNLHGNVTGNTNGTHTGAVIGDVTGNSSTATRLQTARSIALKDGATGTATAFSGAANISIPVTALNAGYLNSGTVAVGRLAGDYNIGITGKATTAGAADTARYASTTGLLKDTDGDTPGQFTMRTTSGGVVEFGGTTPRTSVTFGGSGAVQPTDYWLGTAGTGILHGQSTSATKLHNIRTIALGTGATGTATNFDGTANIVIPVTDLNAGYLTAGTVDAARLTGLYNIAISGKANTAGQADNATNVNGGTVSATTGAFSGALTVNGVSRFNNDITIYGNETDRSLIFDGVNSTVAKWRLMHSATGSGEANYFRLQSTGSAGSSYSDVVRFGMDTKDAVFSGNVLPTANNSKNLGSATYKFANVYATNLNGTLTGNASSATKLATARTIALSTGATGTATAFDGTGNIVIPVTALDAARLSAGVIPTARLSGTYAIGISGKAATAGAADTAVNATNAGTATNVSGGSVNATTGAFSGAVTTDYNFVTNGGDLSLKAPVTTGGWARGLTYYSSDGTTNYGGIGMRGEGTTLNHFYIGWGSSPSAPTYGLTMGTTGATSLKGSLNVSNGITGALTGNATSATRLAAARTIALGTGATGTATAFDGSANITIPVTALNAGYLNTGTVESARLSGTYNIGISGKASTAGNADTATSAGKLVPTYGAQSSFADPAVNVNILGTPNDRDTWIYKDSTANWGIYHRNIGSTVLGLPADSIGFIGNSVLKAYINLDNGSSMFGNTLINTVSGNYNEGIRISKAANNYAIMMLGVPKDSLTGITANAGQWFIASNPNNNLIISDESSNESTGLVIRGDGNLPTWKGTSLASVNSNVASATKLATARTIALGTGATGTATAFDGTTNIVIPVTEVNATYLLSGTVAPARLSGTYAIGISGKAATAGAADTATSASSATKLSTARSLNVTGAATGTAASFDGTGNVNIAVNSLDPTKLMTVDAAGLGIRYNAVSFNNNSSSVTGAIKIKVPGTNTMMNIEIDVYEPNSNGVSKIIIGGYTYSASGNWQNTSVSVLGSYNKGVRLANDGSGFCIILGNASTDWHYPKVNVAKVTAGYSNVSEVTNGIWTASLITDESGLMNIVSPTPTAAQSATKLAAARTISLGTGATGTATAFDGTANITIPITALNAGYLSAGTIPTARLSGTYAIGISGKAATAGAADTATSANSAATATNVSGGSVNATTGSFSGLLTANKGIQLNRAGGATTGINYYSPSYTSWQTIMSPAGTASGVSGNVTSPAGTYVTSWALRNIVEPSAGYGWTWESMAATGTTSAIVAELSSATGNFKTKGSVSADGGFSGSLTGNATTATQLAVARTIALNTAATGTATAFNGTANISIPVTALNAGYLSAGTIPTARLTGLYNIDISGTAELARGLTGGLSSVAYATSAGTAGQLVPTYGAQSSYTETAVNVNIVGTPNDRDTWIYRDAATGPTGTNWGIYMRNIDSDVAGLPANSVGFIGNSVLRAYINLSNGNAGFGSINTSGIHMDAGQIYAANANGDLTYGGAIQVRETGYVGAGTDNWETAPKITFHWGNRAAASLALASNQQFYKINNGGGSQELMITSANIGSYKAGSATYADALNSTNIKYLYDTSVPVNGKAYLPADIGAGLWYVIGVRHLDLGSGHSDYGNFKGLVGKVLTAGAAIYTNYAMGSGTGAERFFGVAIKVQ